MNVKDSITRLGQPFYDEPIVVHPRGVSILAWSISCAFGTSVARRPIVVGHNRVKLEWMKPDGKGGLRPMNNGSDSEERE